MTFLNFLKEQHRRYITACRTNCAYFSVDFKKEGDDNMNSADGFKRPAGHYTRTSRILVLKALYESIELSLEGLAQCAIHGLKCTSTDGSEILFHILLTSYFADIHECEDMLSIKWGTKTGISCHNFVVAKNNYNPNRIGKRRNLGKTLGILNRLKKRSTQAEQQLRQPSTWPMSPFLSSFPFMGVHRSDDVYVFFWLERLRGFSLGISIMLKERLCLYFPDTSRTTTAMTYQSSNPKPFNVIQKCVPKLLHASSKKVDNELIGNRKKLTSQKVMMEED